MPDAAKRYRAFISYSHAADGQLAPALQKALHRFAKPLFAARAINVFRDGTNLSTSPGLWSSVERELADAEFFVLLASPDAAKSKWVHKEVDYWLTHASGRTLLIVLTDGSIAYDEPRGDFDWNTTTALPPNLAGVYAEEPHYLDLRWARGAADLTLKDQRFREAVADLAAALHRRPKHEMLGEDLDRQRRLRKVIASVVSAIILLIVVSGGLAMATSQQRRLAIAGQLAGTARDEVTSNAERAILLALEAVNQSATIDAVKALREVLIKASTRLELERLKDTIRTDSSGLVATAFGTDVSSRDGSLIVRAGDRFELRVERKGIAESVTFREHRDEVNGVDISPDNRLVASVDQDGKGYVWDSGTGKVVFAMRTEMDGYGYARALWSPDGRLLLTGGQDSQTQVWERDTWRRVAVFSDMRGSADLLAISPDGTSVITGSKTDSYGVPVERAATAWELRTGKSIGSRSDPGMVVDSVAFSPDSRLALIEYDGASSELWSPRTGEVIATWGANGLIVPPDLDRGAFEIDAAGLDFSGEGVLGVVRLGFSADGHVLATIDTDEDVLLWQAPFWKRLDETEPQRTNIAAAAAPESSAREVKSPDGTLMVRIGDGDGSGDVVLATGAVIGTLKQDTEPVLAAAFSPNGTWVAVANGTRKVRVHRWETIATLDMLQTRATTLVTRSLTQAERAQFVPGLWQRLTAWR